MRQKQLMGFVPAMRFTRLRFCILQNRQNANFTRGALSAGLGLNFLFGIAEYFLVSSAWREVLFVRLVLVTPPVAATIIGLRSNQWIRRYRLAMALLMLWIGLCAVTIAYFSYNDIGPVSFISIAVALIYVLLLSRLPLDFSMLPAALTLGAMFAAGQVHFSEGGLQLIIAELLVLSIGVLCALSAYQTDRNLWSAFLIQRRLVSVSAGYQFSANFDPLTGLLNRRAMNARLQANMHFDGYVALLDIDHFKSINDTHGHAAGDEVLKQLGDVLRDELLGKDIAVRWGGEEFLLLLTAANDAEAHSAAMRILSALRRKPVYWQGDSIHVTATIGLARCSAEDVHACIACADQALYRGKRSGRDVCVIFEAAQAAKPSAS